MKTLRNCLAALALGACCLSAYRAKADLEVSTSVQIHAAADFEAPLTPHGGWVTVGTYGRCWHPAHVEVGWRPYCDGSWVWTDCGWYWSTDEPWGWACYHYGTWVDDPGVGWVWVPGVEWAPAWVEWRVGGGYIGWAPLAPRGVIVVPGLFGFVEIGHFHDHFRPATLVVNNTTIINKTARVSGTSRATRTIEGRSQQVVINNGPKVADVQKATGRQIAAVPIREAAQKNPAPRTLSTPDRGREPERISKPPEVDKSKPAPREDAPPKIAPERGRPEAAPQSPAEPSRGKPSEVPSKAEPRERGSAPVQRPEGPSRGQDDGRDRGGDRGGGGDGGGRGGR